MSQEDMLAGIMPEPAGTTMDYWDHEELLDLIFAEDEGEPIPPVRNVLRRVTFEVPLRIRVRMEIP